MPVVNVFPSCCLFSPCPYLTSHFIYSSVQTHTNGNGCLQVPKHINSVHIGTGNHNESTPDMPLT